jgi:nucleoid DNA-binding protein
MRTRQVMILGVLLGAFMLALSLSAPAQFKRSDKAPPVPTPAPAQASAQDSLVQRIVQATKLSPENTDRFLRALGPAIRDELKQGKQVSLPGLGTFRVVQVAEHRDLNLSRGGLETGAPVVIPTTNVIEFVAEGTLDEAANSDTARPAETVPEFKYIPLPGQTPSNKVTRIRTPPTRAR